MSTSEISIKMATIRTLFEQGKSFVGDIIDIVKLSEQLENVDAEFRSVGYEGASMALALADLSKGDELDKWNLFLKHNATAHETQIYVGLGWALAQQNKYTTPLLKSFSPLMQIRLMDGCGYYDGVFRQRQSIISKKVPEGITANNLFGYYQGIGRSIWYSCKADADKVVEVIARFPIEYHSDLWRGVGIACSYVGGCDELLLNKLFAVAEKHCMQLAIGAALVAKSRMEAHTFTIDIERVCLCCCNISADEAMQIAIDTLPLSSATEENIYKTWMTRIEQELINKSRKNKQDNTLINKL